MQELATNRSEVVTVPAKGDVLMAASNQSNFTSGGYGDVLRRGFDATPVCLSIEASLQTKMSFRIRFPIHKQKTKN